MADRIFTDELRVALTVPLVKAHGAGRQGIAQPAVARRGKGNLARYVDRPGIARHPADRAGIDLARRNALHVEEADLLGLIVRDRGARADRIEVEVADLFAP